MIITKKTLSRREMLRAQARRWRCRCWTAWFRRSAERGPLRPRRSAAWAWSTCRTG